MHVKLKTVAAASAATFLLAACGSGEEGGQAASGERAGEGTGESCTIEAPVPIGAALSLTGAAASYGAVQQKGLELAVEELTEKEGVTYELTVEDDQTDPQAGHPALRAVRRRAAPASSSARRCRTPPCRPTRSRRRQGVPVLGVSNTAAGITEIGDYIFRDSLTEGAVIPQTIARPRRQLGLKKVVVMYSNDDAFTESGYEAFEAALDDEGVEIADDHHLLQGRHRLPGAARPR